MPETKIPKPAVKIPKGGKGGPGPRSENPYRDWHDGIFDSKVKVKMPKGGLKKP